MGQGGFKVSLDTLAEIVSALQKDMDECRADQRRAIQASRAAQPFASDPTSTIAVNDARKRYLDIAEMCRDQWTFLNALVQKLSATKQAYAAAEETNAKRLGKTS